MQLSEVNTKPNASSSEIKSIQEIKNINLLEDPILRQAKDQTINRIGNFNGSKDEDFSIWFDDLNDALKKFSISEKEKNNNT